MLEFFRGKVTPKDWAFVLVIVAVCALLVGLFVLVVQKKQQEKIGAVEVQVTQKAGELAEAKHNAANIDALRALEKYTARLSEQLRLRLPDEQEFADFLQTLENIGDHHELNLSFKSGKTRREQFKETQPYTVTATGDFHRIMRFVNDLECYERYVRVDDIDIKYIEAGASEAKFVVSTFRFLEPEPETAPSSERAKP